ncbi:MAG: ATP-dependent Clp protease adaptor ClpS [Planctomycetota bacterium]
MGHGEQTVVRPEAARPKPRTAPLWHVVLLDDDDHTYEYVIEMLGKVFGYGVRKAFALACEVDTTGRVIVDTTHFERAELKQQQIHACGADPRIARSAGSMTAVLEPAQA